MVDEVVVFGLMRVCTVLIKLSVYVDQTEGASSSFEVLSDLLIS